MSSGYRAGSRAQPVGRPGAATRWPGSSRARRTEGMLPVARGSFNGKQRTDGRLRGYRRGCTGRGLWPPFALVIARSACLLVTGVAGGHRWTFVTTNLDALLTETVCDRRRPCRRTAAATARAAQTAHRRRARVPGRGAGAARRTKRRRPVAPASVGPLRTRPFRD